MPTTKDVSRREFVKTSAAVIAPIVAGGLLASSRAHAAKPDQLKVGLIGCGGRGTGAAAQALRADEYTVLTAVGDVFADRIESSLSGLHRHFGGGEHAASKIDVPAERQFVGFDAYQRVIDSGVDVVLLTAPPGFRPAHFKAAVEAGKHVFAEKPVAVDAPGIRTMLAAVEQAKHKQLSIVSGFCWRYADAERAIFSKLHESDGLIGDIITVHSTYHSSTLGKRPRQPGWTDMEWQLRNWWHFTWLSGDHLVEQACHSVDRLRWALGGAADQLPVRCTALGGRAARQGPESGNVFDHFTVIYEYANGRRGFLTCRQIDQTPGDNSDYIYGARGSATVNGFTPLHEIRDMAGQRIWRFEGQSKDMYQNEHDALFASIRNTAVGNGAPINDGESMCHSTLMAIMGRMAAYTGQTITWEQALNSQQDLTPAKLEFGDLEVAPVPVPGITKFV